GANGRWDSSSMSHGSHTSAPRPVARSTRIVKNDSDIRSRAGNHSRHVATPIRSATRLYDEPGNSLSAAKIALYVAARASIAEAPTVSGVAVTKKTTHRPEVSSGCAFSTRAHSRTFERKPCPVVAVTSNAI